MSFLKIKTITWKPYATIIDVKLPTQRRVISRDDVNAPTESAKTLVNAEMRIAGPTSDNNSATRYPTCIERREGWSRQCLQTRCHSWIIKNEESTPMAKTKNGITHKMDENLMPKVNKSPSAVAHDMKGRMQAATAKMIFGILCWCMYNERPTTEMTEQISMIKKPIVR